jgi:hypothetical protein
MATQWQVEGTGSATKIIAICPVCHTSRTFHGVPVKIVKQLFKHDLCDELVEPIPTEIRNLYWDCTVVSQC